jgi:hypothetical protein
VALCRWFVNQAGDGARFAWETQGPGVPFGLKVTELGYRNVYLRRNEFSYSQKQQDTPGWMPTPQNKRALLEEYRAALSSRTFINRSREAVEECLNFVHMPNGAIEHSGTKESEDPTGARANHGDRVIADALAWKMAKDVETAPAPKDSAFPVGSFGWRRQLAEQRAREAKDGWG